MSDRARTETQKRVVIERIYAAWCARPQLRLGQMLCCAAENDLFFDEDFPLAARAEKVGECEA